jgi:hypothetical protein
MSNITDRPSSAPTGRDAGLPTPDDYQPYRPLSLAALAGFVLAALCAVLVCLGGWIGVCYHHYILFAAAVVLAPAVAALICVMLGIFSPARILTIAGFALAGMLAVLGLGGLLAYSGSDPWLLPFWLLVLPLAGLLFLWIGRTQIVRSENTLSGLPLCNWGMGAIAVFGLVYLAYYYATWTAMWLESEAFAKQWVEQLGKGEVDGAFLFTLPPDQRPPQNAETRTKLETLFNQPGPRGEGSYSAFCARDFVRLIAGAPGDTKVESPRLMDWKYVEGQYEVLYRCRAASPVCAFDLDITTRSYTNAKGPAQGRQWFVEAKATGRSSTEPIQFTPNGQVLVDQLGPAREFAQGWIEKWYRLDDPEAAYLETLPPAERPLKKVHWPLLGAVLGGPAQWAEPSWVAYTAGSLVQADAKTFYAARPAYRESIPTKLRDAFRPDQPKPDRAMVNVGGSWPTLQLTADGATLAFDARMLFDKDTQPVDVDARLIVGCDAASLEARRPQWRVVHIQLIRARTALAAPPEPGGKPIQLP